MADTGQRDYHLAVAFEPHARSRAVGVEQHRAAGRNHRLPAVEFVELDAAPFEHAFHMVGDPLVGHQFAAEHSGQGLFGDVVLGGAEPPGDDDDVGISQGAFHAPDDLCAVVADRNLFVYDDAGGVEVLGDGYGVRIHDLADEDFIADGVPVPLIPKMAELLSVPGTEINKAALGVDIRSGQNFSELEKILKDLDQSGTRFEILYLESSDDVLVKRYKETRRFHPLAGSDGRVEDGLKRERELLGFLKKKADYLVDTSHMLTRELKAELNKIFVQNKEYKNLYITVLSFGFKYGIPNDADLVFDVRFLPNPYYIEELRPMSGNDHAIRLAIRPKQCMLTGFY